VKFSYTHLKATFTGQPG